MKNKVLFLAILDFWNAHNIQHWIRLKPGARTHSESPTCCISFFKKKFSWFTFVICSYHSIGWLTEIQSASYCYLTHLFFSLREKPKTLHHLKWIPDFRHQSALPMILYVLKTNTSLKFYPQVSIEEGI